VWHYDNGGSSNHTSTQNGPLSLWNTGTLNPGDTSSAVVIKAAGVYPYHCNFHPSTMIGKVRVPILVSPSSGGTGTLFTITLASASQTGFTFDIQRKIGANAWMTWKTGVTSLSVTTKPASPGTYKFRSRLHKTSNGATSGYSPAGTITVS